jgi:hypothetical protein
MKKRLFPGDMPREMSSSTIEWSLVICKNAPPPKKYARLSPTLKTRLSSPSLKAQTMVVPIPSNPRSGRPLRKSAVGVPDGLSENALDSRDIHFVDIAPADTLVHHLGRERARDVSGVGPAHPVADGAEDKPFCLARDKRVLIGFSDFPLIGP